MGLTAKFKGDIDATFRLFLDEVERQIVIKELEKVRKITKDEFIQQMFDTSIERLRK